MARFVGTAHKIWSPELILAAAATRIPPCAAVDAQNQRLRFTNSEILLRSQQL